MRLINNFCSFTGVCRRRYGLSGQALYWNVYWKEHLAQETSVLLYKPYWNCYYVALSDHYWRWVNQSMMHLNLTWNLILSIFGIIKWKLEIRESDWFCNCFLFNNELMSSRFLYEVTVDAAEGRISASSTIALQKSRANNRIVFWLLL